VFRLLILSIFIVAGCGNATRTEPKVIKVFDNTPSIKSKTSKHQDCNWEKVELPIFSQSSQLIKFEYHNCPHEGATTFTVKDGNEIFAHSDVGPLHILSIWKMGAHSEESFLKSLIPEEENRENCNLIQDEQKNWKIGADGTTNAGWVLYPSLSGGCYTYYNSEKGWIFTFKKGIAVGYLDVMNKLAFYDLNSIIYENRGSHLRRE